MIKRSINAIGYDERTMHMDADQWMLAAGSEDVSEAVRAFFERRPGNYSGN